MRSSHKICSAITAAVFALAATTAAFAGGTAESQKGMTVGVSVLSEANTFWAAWLAPIQAFCKEKGITLMINDPNNMIEKQVAAIENWTSLGVSGIIVCPVDPTAVSVATDKAMDKGIKVFAAFYKLDRYDGYNYASQYDMGHLEGVAAGNWINAHLKDQPVVEVVTTNLNTIPATAPREKGAEDGVLATAPNAKIVGTALSSDAASGVTVAEDFLQAHPHLRVFLGEDDSSGLGALEAFKAAGKTDPDQYLIAGIDGSDPALQQIADKTSIFQITVNQDARVFGENSIENLYKALTGQPYDKETKIPVSVIDRDNIGKYVDANGKPIHG